MLKGKRHHLSFTLNCFSSYKFKLQTTEKINKMTRLSTWEKSGNEANAETWQDLAQNSGLDFTVDKIAQRNELTGEKLPWFGLYREDTEDCLSIVGKGYEVCQPSQVFTFLDSLAGTGAEYTRAGFFGKGEKIFVQMNIGEFDVLGSGDVHQKFLTGINSFDGSTSEIYKTTGTRIVCKNTFDYVVKDKNGKEVKFRHTRNAANRRNDAIILLESAQITGLALQEKFEALAQRRVNSAIVGQSIAQIFGIDLAKDLTPSNAERVAIVKELFERNDENAFPEFRGTAYNLVNSFSEFADHYKTAKNTSGNGGTTPERQRAFSSIFGSGEKFKTEAMELVLELTKNAESTNTMKSYSYAETSSLVADLLH